MRLLIVLITMMLLNPITATAAAPQQFASSAKRSVMVELFTSEGCSSCPSADKWLSGLVEDERLWKTIVPIAFHVDYWDYIGWQDRFARTAFGERQRRYRQLNRVRSVYTPGFVVGGKEWRGWFSWPNLNISSQNDIGPLVVNLNGTQFSAAFEPSAKINTELELHIAIVGFGITTTVTAGENHGRQLQHDFVALDYQAYPMPASAPVLSAKPRYIIAASMPDPAVHHAGKRLGLVAWVSASDDPLPIQSVGGWLQ